MAQMAQTAQTAQIAQTAHIKYGGSIIHYLYTQFNILNNGIEDKRFTNIIARKDKYRNTIKIKHEIYNKSDDIYIWYIYDDKYYVDVWHRDPDEEYSIALIINMPIPLFYNKQTPKGIRKLVLSNSQKINIEWGKWGEVY